MAEEREKILYQYTMSYKAYRRKMLSTRISLTLIVTGGLAAMCVLSVALGIMLAITAFVIGVISIMVSYGNEQTYSVYNTKVVIKKRNRDGRITVATDTVTDVKYKRAFYEKDLATGTVTITGRDDRDRKKKYRLYHIFDAEEGIRFLRSCAEKNKQ